jgi:two-component system, OmpR family, response regulator
MRRILVIDDSEIVLSRMKRCLEAEGYEVIATSQLVGNARYLHTCDLVILDYHMPGLDGATVLSSLRSVTGASRRVPIVLYTSDERLAVQYAKLGFDAALTAKGDDDKLARQIAALFRIVDMRAAKARR